MEMNKLELIRALKTQSRNQVRSSFISVSEMCVLYVVVMDSVFGGIPCVGSC